MLQVENAKYLANRQLSPYLAELGARAFGAFCGRVPRRRQELLEEFFCYIPGVIYGDSCNHDLGRGVLISEVVELEFLGG